MTVFVAKTDLEYSGCVCVMLCGSLLDQDLHSANMMRKFWHKSSYIRGRSLRFQLRASMKKRDPANAILRMKS